MPNWVTTLGTISCNNDKEAYEKVKKTFIERFTKGSGLSFQSCDPMPKELEGTKAPSDEPNWYDWHCEHWGTKWDVDENNSSYEFHDDDNSITFCMDTAWDMPCEVLTTLSKLLGEDAVIDVKYADEDWSCNCGYAQFSNGEAEVSPCENESDEAKEVAYDVLGYDPSEEDE